MRITFGTTTQDLLDLAKSKNLKVEIETNEYKESLIGFCTGRGVWHWFKVWNILNKTYMTFEESYSQNTGRCSKGIRQGWYAEEMIAKRLGLPLYYNEKEYA